MMGHIALGPRHISIISISVGIGFSMILSCTVSPEPIGRLSPNLQSIMKTGLFKYIENFTTQN